MGEIYERMDRMVGEIKDIMTQDDNPHKRDYSEVEEIIMACWEKMNIPLHSLAFTLTPNSMIQDIEKSAPRGYVRKAPQKDPDVMKAVLEAVKNFGNGDNEQKILRQQFSYFIFKKGMYAMSAVKLHGYNMDAIYWWEAYGSETPNLAAVAVRILSQPISSSLAERIQSTYEYIHNAKRNKLNADKLVFVHVYLHSKWDIDPNNSTI